MIHYGRKVAVTLGSSGWVLRMEPRHEKLLQQASGLEPRAAARGVMFPQVRKVLGCRLIGEEYVIVFSKRGADHALVLNPAGSRAFYLMDGRHRLEQIAKAVAEGMSVPSSEMLPVVRKMVKRLERLGIVATRRTAWKTPCPVFLQRGPRAAFGPALPAVVQMERLEVPEL
jgi:hypothetical protein